MTKNNQRVRAVRLGTNETSALEVKRWLEKWGIPAVLDKENGGYNVLVATGVSKISILEPGNWVVIKDNQPWVWSDHDFDKNYWGRR